MAGSMSDAALLEVAFPRSLIALKVRGAEQTINEHLVKLMAFEVEPALRESWKRELVRKHFAFLSRLRLKPDRRAVRARDFFDWLYDEPFEGNELGYTEALIGLSADMYTRNGVTLPNLAARLRGFHASLAEELSEGRDAATLVAAL
jgi:hypothetical protein